MKAILFRSGYLASVLDGWYLKLLLGPSFKPQAYEMEGFTDYLVADYHTTPTDCYGNMMGWVSHAGTGAVDLAIVVAPDASGKMMAYAGPVASYHEYVTTNFQRLTDEEWAGGFLASASRPNWVNLYLADMAGKTRGPGGTLLTGVADRDEDNNDRLPTTHVMAQNYPNPFNAGTLIRFTVPYHLTNAVTALTIYDIQGKMVTRLVEKKLPAGTYVTRWEGTDDFGNKVASGVYLYRLMVGTEQFLGKMNLLK